MHEDFWSNSLYYLLADCCQGEVNHKGPCKGRMQTSRKVAYHVEFTVPFIINSGGR